MNISKQDVKQNTLFLNGIMFFVSIEFRLNLLGAVCCNHIKSLPGASFTHMD